MLNAALFGAIAAGQSSAPPAATLPEDEPLPAATATLNATTANFRQRLRQCRGREPHRPGQRQAMAPRHLIERSRPGTVS